MKSTLKYSIIAVLIFITLFNCTANVAIKSDLNGTKWIGTDGENIVSLAFISTDTCIIENEYGSGKSDQAKYIWNSKIMTGSISIGESDDRVISFNERINILKYDDDGKIVLFQIENESNKEGNIEKTKWYGIENGEIVYIEFGSNGELNGQKLDSTSSDDSISGKYTWDQQQKAGNIALYKDMPISLVRNANCLELSISQSDGNNTISYFVKGK